MPGSELRLQVAEETKEIISAMLVIETAVVPRRRAGRTAVGTPRPWSWGRTRPPAAAVCGRSCARRSPAAATAEGGSASLREGPFGVELRRLIPVTTPDGEQGYQPSRMWVAEGPRWLLRGIVYGQAAVEDDLESPVVAEVLDAFRQVVVRRGDEAMAPGDLLPLTMPSTVGRGRGEGLTAVANSCPA